MKLINYAFILLFSLLSLTIAQDDDDFEFDDDDFEFDEDEFDLEGIDEFDLEDDDFDNLLEEFELQEEEGFEEGEPRKFGLGLNLGSTMPFGQNLRGRFSPGIHAGLKIESPFGFYFGPFEIVFGAEISYATMNAIEDPIANPSNINYEYLNLILDAKTKILFIDLIGGFGIVSASAPDPTDGSELPSETIPTVIVDASYSLLSLNPIVLDLNFRAQETLGVPGVDLGTSDMIGFSLRIKYLF